MGTLQRIEEFVDHALVQAVLGEVPVAGGIASYWRDKIAERREREFRECLNGITRDIISIYDAMRSKVDVGHLRSVEFSSTVAVLVEQAIRETSEIKKAYLRTFAVQYGLTERPDKVYGDIFLSLVKSLSGLHITVLHILYERQFSLSEQDLSILITQDRRKETVTLGEMIEKTAAEEGLLRVVAQQLLSGGLVSISGASAAGLSRQSNIVLTGLSKKFVCFLRGEWHAGS